jgi:hypothetical protein
MQTSGMIHQTTNGYSIPAGWQGIEIFAELIVYAQPAVFHQQENGCTGEGLGHGGDGEKGTIGYGYPIFQVGHSIVCFFQSQPVFNHSQLQPGNLSCIHRSPNGGINSEGYILSLRMAAQKKEGKQNGKYKSPHSAVWCLTLKGYKT